jgi:hypothetical protein
MLLGKRKNKPALVIDGNYYMLVQQPRHQPHPGMPIESAVYAPDHIGFDWANSASYERTEHTVVQFELVVDMAKRWYTLLPAPTREQVLQTVGRNRGYESKRQQDRAIQIDAEQKAVAILAKALLQSEERVS